MVVPPDRSFATSSAAMLANSRFPKRKRWKSSIFKKHTSCPTSTNGICVRVSDTQVSHRHGCANNNSVNIRPKVTQAFIKMEIKKLWKRQKNLQFLPLDIISNDRFKRTYQKESIKHIKEELEKLERLHHHTEEQKCEAPALHISTMIISETEHSIQKLKRLIEVLEQRHQRPERQKTGAPARHVSTKRISRAIVWR